MECEEPGEERMIKLDAHFKFSSFNSHWYLFCSPTNKFCCRMAKKSWTEHKEPNNSRVCSHWSCSGIIHWLCIINVNLFFSAFSLQNMQWRHWSMHLFKLYTRVFLLFPPFLFAFLYIKLSCYHKTIKRAYFDWIGFWTTKPWNIQLSFLLAPTLCSFFLYQMKVAESLSISLLSDSFKYFAKKVYQWKHFFAFTSCLKPVNWQMMMTNETAECDTMSHQKSDEIFFYDIKIKNCAKN